MNRSEEVSIGRSPTSRFLIYAMPRFATSLLLGIIGFALFFLYTLAYNVNSVLVGSAISMGYLSIAASQFLLGWISDAKYTRWGRRKPYIILLSPMLSLSFIFVLLPTFFLHSPDETTLFLWLLVWDVIFEASYGVTTPYQAWTAEQFTVEERPKASQYQNIFNFVGNGVMAAFTMIVLTGVKDRIVADPNVIPPEFLFTVVLFAIILVAVFYLNAFLMPTERPFRIESSLIDNLKTILKNKNFISVTVMQGICGLAWIMTTTVMLSYLEVVLDFGTIEYAIAAVCMLIGIMVFLHVWRKLIKKLGKKQSLLYVFLIAAVFLPISLIGMIPMESTFIFGMIFILGIAAILGGWFLFPYIMYADLAEDDEKRTGELKAGIYTGFPSIVLNLFQALGTYILGIAIALPNITVGNLSYSIGYVLWGPICSGILICSWLYTRKFVTLDFEWEKANR